MNTLKTLFHKLKDSLGKLGRHPSFDWYFAFTCFVVGILIVACLDTLFYYQFSADEETEKAVTKSDLISLSKDKVADTLEKSHQKDSDSLSIPNIVLSDPSL